MKLSLITGILVLLAASCQYIPVISSTDGNRPGGTEKGAYSEDLSSLRPVYEVDDLVIPNGIPEQEMDSSGIGDMDYIPVNDTVNMVLDSIASLRLAENKVMGFTILVYSSTNREDARKALGRLIPHIPDTKADLVYQQPYFRVKTGRFMHEIHAHELMEKIKGEFPTAIIIPETFKIITEDAK